MHDQLSYAPWITLYMWWWWWWCKEGMSKAKVVYVYKPKMITRKYTRSERTLDRGGRRNGFLSRPVPNYPQPTGALTALLTPSSQEMTLEDSGRRREKWHVFAKRNEKKKWIYHPFASPPRISESVRPVGISVGIALLQQPCHAPCLNAIIYAV